MSNKIVLAVSALAALSACGSTPVTTSTEIIAQDNGDTVQAALIEGKTVAAKPALMNAVVLDRATGSAMPIDPMSFGIKLPSGTDEDVTMILSGTEVNFTSAERQFQSDGVTYYGWEQSGSNPRYSLWTWSNGPAPNSISAAGSSYVNIWEAFFDRADGTEYKAYTVSGTETAGQALSGLGTATYSGYVEVKAYPNGGYNGFDTVDRIEGDVSLTADFGGGTISGAISNMTFGPSRNSAPRSAVAGTIALSESAIGSDGQYSGTLQGDTAFLAETDDGAFSGSYAGDFFGPVGNQTAGALSASFAAGGNSYVGTGFYNAFKD